MTHPPASRLLDYRARRLSPEACLEVDSHVATCPSCREQVVEAARLPSAMLRQYDDLAESLTAGLVDHVSEEDLLAYRRHELATSARRSSAWSPAAAAAIALAVTAAVILAARQTSRGTSQAAASPPPAVSTAASPRTGPVSPKPRDPDPATVQVVRLTGTPGPRVTLDLPPSAQVVRLEVPVDPESLSFDASVRDGRGRALWRGAGLVVAAAHQPLVVEVPAATFASGVYTLRVEGEPLRGSGPRVLEYPLEVISASPR